MKSLMLIVILLLSNTAYAFNFESPQNPSASIILSQTQIAKQISPVKLLEVNGENINVRSDVVWLKPGEYELKFAALVDRSYTHQNIRPVKRRKHNDKRMTLNIKVEADKSYYVGFDTSNRRTHEWKTIVYKVE